MTTPSPRTLRAIEVVPVAWLDADDVVSEYDPALSDEELASDDADWRTVATVERRATSTRVVFDDGSTATGYPEVLVVRLVGGAA